MAQARRIVSMPGVFSPTEALLALRCGASALKFFPASVLGPSGIAAQLAVLPKDTVAGAVGSMSDKNLAAYRAAGSPGIRPRQQPLSSGHDGGRSAGNGAGFGRAPMMASADATGRPSTGACDKFNTTGKSLLFFRNHVKPRNEKYSLSEVGANQYYEFRHPGPHEGRFAIVTKRRAGVVMDASASGGNLARGRKRRGVRPSRVVLTPVAGAKLAEISRRRR